jgi:hypothetical protein
MSAAFSIPASADEVKVFVPRGSKGALLPLIHQARSGNHIPRNEVAAGL